MARETVYLVQAFRPGKGTQLTADTPLRYRSPELARRSAENLAPTRAGVVAFSSSGDAESGDYDDQPVILFKAGRVPDAFEQA